MSSEGPGKQKSIRVKTVSPGSRLHEFELLAITYQLCDSGKLVNLFVPEFPNCKMNIMIILDLVQLF